MASQIDTLYNFNSTGSTNTEEQYTDVGSDKFQLGTAARGFKSTSFSIKNSGSQEISNTGSLGAFVGSTVPAIATQTDYELDVTVDGVLYQLATISINVADDWDGVCDAIQTSLRTATSSAETCEIVGDNIRISSITYGASSTIVIAAGTAGTGSGDLLAVIDAIGATYTTSIETAEDGGTLTVDVDYEISDLDQDATVRAGYNVYTRVKVLTAYHQTGNLYITYSVVYSTPDAEYFNDIKDDVDSAVTGSQVLQSYISGLEISNGIDTDHDIDITAGQATTDDNSKYLTLPSTFTKQIDASFSKGTDQGGLDTGTVANDTFYYFWLIEQDSTGDTDILISASPTSPTMPSGWTAKAFTGDAVLTDGSANILPFRLKGNDIKYKQKIQEIAATPANTTKINQTTKVPPEYLGNYSVSRVYGSAVTYTVINEVGDTDVAASASNFDLRTSTTGSTTVKAKQLQTDSSSQISYRTDTAAGTLYIFTEGFINSKR